MIERATLPVEGWEDLVKDIVSILPDSRPVFMLGKCKFVIKFFNFGMPIIVRLGRLVMIKIRVMPMGFV